MTTLDWSKITLCPTCFALVPVQALDQHEQWHDNIAVEAIRSSKRLDRLESPE